MSRRGSTDDGSEGPETSAGASFDAAQDLLLAALAEIRGEPAPVTPDAPVPPSARESDAPWAAPTGSPDRPRPGAGRSTTPPPPAQPTLFWHDEPETGTETPGEIPAGSTGRRRPATAAEVGAEGTRRRRRSPRSADPASPGSAELDGLTESLYEPTGGDRRRRRAGRTADAEHSLPPESRPVVAASLAGATAVTPPTDDASAPLEAPSPTHGGSEAWRNDTADPDDEVLSLDEIDLDNLDNLDDTDEVAVVEPDDGSFDEEFASLAAFAASDELPAAASAAGLATATVAASATRDRTRGDSSPPGSSGSRRRNGIVAIAIVAVVALVAVFFALQSGHSDQTALRTPTAAKFTFDPITTPEGAKVTRVWELQGRGGNEFTGSLTMTNPTSVPLPTTFVETIPKAIAPTASIIAFSPQPVVVQPDPVVRYSVTIAPNASFTATYLVTVQADGASRSRLEAWAKEIVAPTTTTSSLPAVTTTVPSTTTTGAARPVATTVPGPTPSPTTPTTEPTPPPTDPPAPPPVVPGRIVLRVVSTGANAAYTFAGYADLTLTTTGSPGYVEWSATVDPGLYPLTETIPVGFRLQGIDCSDRDSGPYDQRSIVAPPKVTFNVQPGETVTCTFTNVKNR